MAVSSDIIRTWRAPKSVIAGLLAMGQREDRAIAYLMAGCFLIFVAQWPRLSRTAFLDQIALERLVAYELLSWMVIWPLLFYALAALIHAAMRLFRRPSAHWTARLVLFWSVLATSPIGLLYGLLTGFIGAGPGIQLVGAIWLMAFVFFVLQGLRAAEASLVDPR